MLSINDMKMPQNCNKCPFADAHIIGGMLSLNCLTNTGRNMFAPDLIYRTERPAWCPLEEMGDAIQNNDK